MVLLQLLFDNFGPSQSLPKNLLQFALPVVSTSSTK